jgi:membrane protease YdiL (CAAX protease family)
MYQQDRRVAQFFYLDMFWVAPFFVVYLYEQRTVSSMGLVLGDSLVKTLEFAAICVLVTLFLFIIAAQREKREGKLRISKGMLIIDNEGVDLRMISLPGFIQIFLMQVMWVALPLEIFFRGYLVSRIAESFNDYAGVLIAALLYYVAYMDKPIFGTINVVLGLLYGYAFVATGSIIPGIVAHMFINTFSFYFARNIAVSQRV